MEQKEFSKRLLQEASASGFTDGEVFFSGSKSMQVLVHGGEILQFEHATEQGVCFRGTFQGNMGYAYSEELSEEAIAFLCREARENAVLIEGEDKEELYAGEERYETLAGFSESLSTLSPETLIADAVRMEQEALSAGAALVEYSLMGYGESEFSITNTKGLSVSHKDNSLAAYVSVVAKQGEEVKTASEYQSGRDYRAFSTKKLAEGAAADAISHLGASSVKSGPYRTVLGDRAAMSLLSAFLPVFFAERAQKGFSLLAGKTGEQIAAECVTIRDDGLYPDSIAAAPFDSEGVAAKNKAVIENGILKTLLYNLKSAKKDGVQSTGNGFKADFSGPVGTSCTVFYLQEGVDSLDVLFQKMGTGLYITEVSGLHAGANAISGDFSLSAEGFWIVEGRRQSPVEQITVSGNFYTLLSKVEAVGADLRFNQGGNIGSPPVLVSEMMISGM